MRNLLLYILLGIVVFSCVGHADKSNSSSDDKAFETVDSVYATVDIIEQDTVVQLDNGLIIKWDSIKCDIRITREELDRMNQDTLLVKFLCDEILDTTLTNISVPFKQTRLRYGDLTFMLLDLLDRFMYMYDFKVQFDVFEYRTPDGILDWLDGNRLFVVKQIRKINSKSWIYIPSKERIKRLKQQLDRRYY